MDKIVNKIVALGVPGLMLLIAVGASGLAGAAAVTTALACLGPGGMIGGVVTLIIASLISEAIAKYGFEAIFLKVCKGLYEKGETKESIKEKIRNYKISKSLKEKAIKYLDELE